MIEVIDNLLPEWFLNRLVHVTQQELKWHIGRTALADDPYYSLATIISPGDPYDELFMLPFLAIKERFNSSELGRVRPAAIPRDAKSLPNYPHVDAMDPHMVGLLYLNDTDGDTFIYKNTVEYDNSRPDLTQQEYCKLKGWSYDRDESEYFKDFEILERVTPRANRLVVFDGRHFHSSSSPTKTQLRYAINYNFR